MAKKIYLDNLELAQKGYVDSALQDKQDTLSPSDIADGTIDKVIGFDSQGNLKKATPSTGSSNYNELSNIPIVNQDLDDANFTPTANTYYRHVGQDDTTYTIGAIYYYDGSEFHEITGSSAPSGDGVVVVELGGYVDADTMESHLTITMEEFMKGIDNDVAFAKVGISNDDGVTIQQYLYLAKVTGQYSEGNYGVLMFSSLFGASSDSQLFGLQVQFEQTGSLNWDIDLNFQVVGGSSGSNDYDELENKPITNQEETSTESLTPIDTTQGIQNGQKIHFDKTADWDSFFAGLTYTPSSSGDYANLIQTSVYNNFYIQATRRDGIYYIVSYINQSMSILYVSDDISIQGVPYTKGWQNNTPLDSNGDFIANFTDTILTYNNDGNWNGNLIGIPSTIIEYNPTGVDGTLYQRNGDLYKYIEKTSIGKFVIGQELQNGDKIKFDTTRNDELVELIKRLLDGDTRKTILSLSIFNQALLYVAYSYNQYILGITENWNDTQLFISTSGWQNLDGNDEYTLNSIQSGQGDIVGIDDFVPNEWNGNFIGIGQTTISKYAKLLTESIEILDVASLGNKGRFLISNEVYNKMVENDNIVIKIKEGSGVYYATKTREIETSDGTTTWQGIRYIAPYTDGDSLFITIDIDKDSYGNYYGSISYAGALPSVSPYTDFYTSQFAQKITSGGTDYNIKESFYTFTSPIASGDTLQQGEQTNSIEYFCPVIINGKKYIFQRQYTNGTNDNIIEYLGSTIENNQIKISMFEYNYTTKVITFVEKIVNNGVAYTTTPPTADNLDGDLKFVVLTQAQATGITKYNGYLYYII